MLYLDSFSLPDGNAEDSFVLSYPPLLEMQCYDHNNIHPFRIFPQKQLTRISFAPITFFYGKNGSGKSTLLNIIAQKLQVTRFAPYNHTPFLEEYLRLCKYRLGVGSTRLPADSRIITSDDVFDFLLDLRSVNEGVDRKRDALFAEYDTVRQAPARPIRSLDDFESFRHQNEIKRKTKSAYVTRRLPKELCGKSNGESAYLYFTQKITENALYLLDEPENSLSVVLQEELVRFIEDSVRFYHCQFIISTHSPFLLAMKGAKVYDLDSIPACEKHWTELENVQIYYRFFQKHSGEFDR